MTPLENSKRFGLVLGAAMAAWACGSAETGPGAGGSTSTPNASAGTATGGQLNDSGAPVATAGATSNGGALVAGGAPSGGVAGDKTAGGGSATSAGDGCTVGKWPAADPTMVGPYATVTENEVGPEAGEADADTGVVPKFTLFRPKELSPNGLCHPVITWGNGTGSTPNLYRSLLGFLASHGFVVIASNSKNVSRGDPKPMLVGITWVLEQNADPTSPLYHHLDATHIGATGHSQGAFATSQASGDARIVTNVPIEGAMVQKNLHGPAMFFCGGQDDIVGCDGAASALNAVTTLPAMYAEYLSVDHGSWMSFNNKPSVVYGAVNAWMRVHLMADDSLRPWFYGEACQLCVDAGWQIQQKNMTP
jgi:Chlorophyllase enzyme